MVVQCEGSTPMAVNDMQTARSLMQGQAPNMPNMDVPTLSGPGQGSRKRNLPCLLELGSHSPGGSCFRGSWVCAPLSWLHEHGNNSRA